MNITTDNIDGITVVRLEGDLDTNSSTGAQKTIEEIIDGGVSNMLVNLKDVGFVSSAGLRILLAAAKKINGLNGKLRISDLNETVQEVFEISGFITILKVFPTEEVALQDT
jgi:anti-sigma B factor antagonist